MNEELATYDSAVNKTESKSGYDEPQIQQFHESTPIGCFTLDACSTILEINIIGAR